MPPAPPAHDPHAFPFCPRCGAYRHQGPCPQPQPLPPTPTMLTPLSSLLSSPPASHAAPPSSSSSSPPPPPPPRRLAGAHYAPSAPPANPLKRRVWARRFGAQLRCPNGDHLTHLSSAARIALAVLIAFLALVAIGLIVNANQ